MSQPTHHGFYLSGIFEVEEKVSPENGWRSEWRTYTLSIGCKGADRDQRLLYEVQAKGFSPAQFRLWANNIYFLRGAFFPSNSPNTEKDQFLFEGSDPVLLAQADDFLGDVVDATGATGVGHVVELKTKVESCCQFMKKVGAPDDLLTTVVTVRHTDYHPLLKAASSFRVEYLIRPTPNLSGIASLVRVGRECRIHGYIKDFNEETNCYVVVANKVYLTDSYTDLDDKGKPKNGVPESASKKPMKFKGGINPDFRSPLKDSGSPSSTALGTPATHSGSSFSTTASTVASTSKVPIPSEFDDLKSLPPAPPKKRGRYQPKRKASNPTPDESGSKDA